MRTRAGAGVCVLAYLGVLLFSSAAWGQTTGSIRGMVKDPSGAVVPAAQVTATLPGTDTTRTVGADKDGVFEIVELPVGHYQVTIDASGFKKFVVKDVAVDIGHVALVNATLQVGGATETVTVEANAVQVETTSTQIGAVMNDQSIRELPLSTRNTYQLLQLQPGVQSQLGSDLFYGSNNPGVVSVNGGRGRSNNYMVNGGDANDIFVNAPGIQPSPDAIEEFRVITNTFDAEYGRNSGSIVNVVTKSGTNEVHGDVYEFLRNNALNDRGYFDPSVADYHQNQFGGTLGGPIKKDKTFIFGSYEGNRRIQGQPSGAVICRPRTKPPAIYGGRPAFTGTLVDQPFATQLMSRATGSSGQTCQQAVTNEGGAPIAAGTAFSSVFPTINSDSVFRSLSVALYNKYVAPFGTGTFSAVPNEAEYENQATARFDQKLSATQQLSIYYYFNNDSDTVPISTFQDAGPNLPGFPAITTTRSQQWNASHTWTIGTSAVNEIRFNYFREGQANLDHPLSTLPSVQDSCGAAVPASDCFTDPTNPSLGITTNLPGRTGIPYIGVDGGFAIGNNVEGELPQTGNSFQWTDTYTKTYANHTIKFGGDFRKAYFNQFLYYNINGDYTFISDSNLCTGGATTGCDAPITNDLGYTDDYPDYFLGTPTPIPRARRRARHFAIPLCTFSCRIAGRSSRA